MNKALITGGTGYIGSHIAVELLKLGLQVVIVDNLSNSKVDSILGIEQITGKSVKFYQVDIKDQTLLSKVFEGEHPDVVIHCAGLKSVSDSIRLPLTYYQENVLGTIVLLQVMKRYSCNNIIYSSSATVYDSSRGQLLTQTSPLSPITPYGWSKYMVQRILQDYQASNQNFRVCIFRYFNPIKSHESGLLKESPLGTPNNLYPLIEQVKDGLRDHIEIYGNDYDTVDGTCVRDYIDVVKLAKYHIEGLKILNKFKLNILNLGTGRGTSVLQLCKEIGVKYVFSQRRMGDFPTIVADVTKFNQLVNMDQSL